MGIEHRPSTSVAGTLFSQQERELNPGLSLVWQPPEHFTQRTAYSHFQVLGPWFLFFLTNFLAFSLISEYFSLFFQYKNFIKFPNQSSLFKIPYWKMLSNFHVSQVVTS